ncbi:MAG TPA: hypothetical protein IAC66_07480 [Candidatus Aphodousia gallistercoris]|nr:hypothetical protein [Candidatus Aphodousia gallistercoris]
MTFHEIMNSDVVVALSLLFGFLACLFAFLSFWITKKGNKLNERAVELTEIAHSRGRPKIGQSHWTRGPTQVFAKLVFYPGNHFTQIKKIYVPGYKVSFVEFMTSGNKRTPLSLEFQESLNFLLSLPVNIEKEEYWISISPIPTDSFEIRVVFALDEEELIYPVSDGFPDFPKND